ncbi:MAG: VCBS repeat-containing protein [Idiomarina sp.]|nr:VCBS repeat-containing protein [Idiomarina sp.]
MMRLVLLCLITLVALVFVTPSHARPWHAYTDREGGLYLRQSPVVVVDDEGQVQEFQPTGSLLFMEFIHGQWIAHPISPRQWRHKNLSRGHERLMTFQYWTDTSGQRRSRFWYDDGVELHMVSFAQAGRQIEVETVLQDRFGRDQQRGFSPMMAPMSMSSMLRPVNDIGQTAHSFRVSESGSASISVPIDLPPVQGISPDVSFVYDSQSGDGQLGVGWSLAAGSGITRCPQNIAMDGQQLGVTYTEHDRLCWNGQRLVPADGSTSYWSAQTYRTEIDSFAVITPIRVPGTQPNEFVTTGFAVQEKSGDTHYFGIADSHVSDFGPLKIHSNENGPDDKKDALFLTPDDVPRHWSLKFSRDASGNVVAYRYHNDPINGEHYLTEIRYAYLNAPSGLYNAPYRVSIEYMPRPRARAGFIAGVRYRSTQMIESVRVFHNNTQIREYVLDYTLGVNQEDRDYLNAIQECGGATGNQCKGPVYFDWKRHAVRGVTENFVCDQPISIPLPPGCYFEEVAQQFIPFSSTVRNPQIPSSATLFTGDFTGNGIDDLVYLSGSQWRVRRGELPGTAQCNFPTPGGTDGCLNVKAVATYDQEVSLGSSPRNRPSDSLSIDYNGSGRRALLVANNSSDNWHIVKPFRSTEDTNVCDYTGLEPLCGPHPGVNSPLIFSINRQAIGLGTSAMIADIDGDGYEDIVFIQDRKIKMYRNNGINLHGSHLGFSAAQTILDLTTRPGSPPQGDPLNGETWDFGMYPTSTFNVNEQSAVFFDMNGNGRTDLLIKLQTQQCSLSQYHTETHCSANGGLWLVSSNYHLLVHDVDSDQLVFFREFGQLENLRLVDLNGDGLTDLLYTAGGQWRYFLSNGVDYEPSKLLNLSASASTIPHTIFVDLTGNGATDILYPTGGNEWEVRLNNLGANADTVTFSLAGFMSRWGIGTDVRVFDASGNGLPDLLYRPSSSDSHRFRQNERDGNLDGLVTGIRTHEQVRTHIRYRQLSRRTVYPNSMSTQFKEFDFATRRGMVVVTQTEQQVSDTGFETTRYRYRGLLINRIGRGILGFEQIETEHVNSGVRTRTLYHQQWPYTGMPARTQSVLGSQGYVLSEAVNSYATRTTASGGIFVYLDSSTEHAYALIRSASGLVTGTEHTASTISTFGTQSEPAYDAYGNVLRSQIRTLDAQGTEVTRVETVNTYGTTTQHQRFGRLAQSTVTHSRPGVPSVVRRAHFTYHPDTLLLKSETLELASAAETRTTEYTYNSYGALIKKKLTGTGVDDREQEWVYSTNASGREAGRLVSESVHDGSGALLTQTSYSPASGPISNIVVTAPTGEQTRTYLDTFGRRTSSQFRPGGGSWVTQSTESWVRCQSSSCVMAGAHVRHTVSGGGIPTQERFYNRFGQAMGTRAQRPLSGWVRTQTNYDTQGRPWRVFEPFNTSPGAYSQMHYDALGQVYRVDLPGGGNTVTTLNGFETTQINALGRTTRTTRNAVGEVVSVRDHQNNALTYAYNATGQLIRVTAPHGIRVQNTYDNAGRKIAMNDADKGSWTYQYNAFDELVSQTTARGQTAVMTYDSLGRKIREHSPDGTVCWNYGAFDATQFRAGRLQSVEQFTGDRTCGTSTGRIYREVPTYNGSGLVTARTVTNNGQSHTTTYTYDGYGRQTRVRHPAVGGLPALDIDTVYQNGHVRGYRRGGTTSFWEQISALNARGQVTQVNFANGVQGHFSYNLANGWLEQQSIQRGSTAYRQMSYGYNHAGHLTHRTQSFHGLIGANTTETFSYDTLDRLTQWSVTGASSGGGGDPGPGDPGDPGGPIGISSMGGDVGTLSSTFTQTYQYDVYGNITFKSDVGTQGGYYLYAGNNPTRLVSVRNGSTHGAVLYQFTYDANGNVLSDSKQTFAYTHFDKPTLVSRSAQLRSEFKYGPARELVWQRDTRQGQVTTRWLFGGYERVQLPDGTIEHRYQVGSTLITRTQPASGSATEQLQWLHGDAQGSTIAITSTLAPDNTVLRQQLRYDPWGKQTSAYQHSSFNLARRIGDYQGYTGHTHVNELELIHMGGRTYNPVLGRFMQADPFIQAGANLQNYNRYSYVLNNPMSYTDPSGYFFKPMASSVWRSISRRAGPEISQAIVAVGSAFCGPYAPACAAAGTYEVRRAHGMSSSGALRAAAVAGASQWAFSPAGGPARPSFGRASFQAGVNVLAAQNPKLGQAMMLLSGSTGHGFDGWVQNAVGGYMQYKVQGELTRFAAKYGLSLEEFNLLLALNSRLGLAVAGTTYDEELGTVEGFFSRSRHRYLGGLWDINDTLLNLQGLLDAISLSVTADPFLNGTLQGHSLGAWRVNNLVRHGFIESAELFSLPGFTHPSYGTTGVCGVRDAICGGAFLSSVRPNIGTTTTSSWWGIFGRNHGICSVSGYRSGWRGSSKC